MGFRFGNGGLGTGRLVGSGGRSGNGGGTRVAGVDAGAGDGIDVDVDVGTGFRLGTRTVFRRYAVLSGGGNGVPGGGRGRPRPIGCSGVPSGRVVALDRESTVAPLANIPSPHFLAAAAAVPIDSDP